jgi:hypothetical protein
MKFVFENINIRDITVWGINSVVVADVVPLSLDQYE